MFNTIKKKLCLVHWVNTDVHKPKKKKKNQGTSRNGLEEMFGDIFICVVL